MADTDKSQESWAMHRAAELGILLVLLTIFTYFKIGTSRWMWIVGITAVVLEVFVTPTLSLAYGSWRTAQRIMLGIVVPPLAAGGLCLVLFKFVDLGGPAPRPAPQATPQPAKTASPTPAKPKVSAPVLPQNGQ